MQKQTYITEVERIRCQIIRCQMAADAYFAESAGLDIRQIAATYIEEKIEDEETHNIIEVFAL